MAVYRIGDLIRKLRLENGYTQEQLSEGICTQKNLSLIESGKHVPHNDVLEMLIERLGKSAEHYFHAFFGAGAYEAFEKRNTLRALIAQRRLSEAEDMVNELERNKFFKEGSNRQFLLNAKANVYVFRYNKYPEALAILHEAIKVTKKTFNEDAISMYLLSSTEIDTISLISICYSSMGNASKATKLLLALKENIDGTKVDEAEKVKKYPAIVYNLTKIIGLQGDYDAAIEYCREAKAMCIRNMYNRMIPFLLFNELWCLDKRGEREAAARLIPIAYYGFIMLEMYSEAKHVEIYAKEEHGIKF